MITLLYWQCAAIAYGINTLTYWCVESKVLFDTKSRLAWVALTTTRVASRRSISRWQRYRAGRRARASTT